jgi:Uma2 family endonuclease
MLYLKRVWIRSNRSNGTAEQPEIYDPEQYLALERGVETKSEYFRGLIYAMSGGSPERSEIAANVTASFIAQLGNRPCHVFTSDLKVARDDAGLFAYPDLSIVCDEPRFRDDRRDVLTNPTAIVEVLSPSTEAYDRGRKFAQYQGLSSLKNYILVAQDEPRVNCFTRQEANQWILSVAEGVEASLYIASIDCTLLLAKVYRGVRFSESPSPLPTREL